MCLSAVRVSANTVAWNADNHTGKLVALANLLRAIYKVRMTSLVPVHLLIPAR